MIDLGLRMEEYGNFQKQIDEEIKIAKDERLELANFVGIFKLKQFVVYKNEKERKTLVVIKDCENCIRENVGIISDFIMGLNYRLMQSKFVMRSTADMKGFDRGEIRNILEFIADPDTKIFTVRPLNAMGESYRWEREAYKQYFYE